MNSEKYKVKIDENHASDFKGLLEEMGVDFKITPYTSTIIIWKVTLSSEKQITTIKNLHYVTFFGVMPIVTVGKRFG